MALNAIIVTWDRDFKKLASRPHNANLSVITFDCPEVYGERRAEDAIGLIEYQFAQVGASGKPLRIEVTLTLVKIGQ
jgi:hypothetical protein